MEEGGVLSSAVFSVPNRPPSPPPRPEAEWGGGGGGARGQKPVIFENHSKLRISVEDRHLIDGGPSRPPGKWPSFTAPLLKPVLKTVKVRPN